MRAHSHRSDVPARRVEQRTGALPALAFAGVVSLCAAAACTDSAVPFFDAPTSVPTSPNGIQNAVTGLFSATRADVEWYVYYTGSYARDFFLFVGSSANTLTDVSGLKSITNTGIEATQVWDNAYVQIGQANAIMISVTHVASYTPAQVAAIDGVVQTLKALNFMMVAETRDSLGIPLYAVDGNPADPPYCNKDVWAYIVALLDSGFTDLNTAGPIPLPVRVPAGFASVGTTAAPSTTQGSFAAFNRALAAKAGLQYAYAIARSSPGTHPTPSTPGNPNNAALTRADSAMTASALYNPAVIAPPAAGPFALDPYGVYHVFSGQSGDLPNVFLSQFFLFDALWDLQNDVDTLNDKRWLNKFVPDNQPVQLSQYAGVSDAKNYLPYSTVSSPVPIVRAEELALVRAQIQLGLGNYTNAVALINQVHMQAGGFATPLSINTASYTAVRDSLLKEQRISTVFEASGDRAIALRMYHLEAIADTTWQSTSAGSPDGIVDKALDQNIDYHTTVASIPVQELTERGGQWNLSCP